MQGSVWGSLFCTASMDKLGQLAYEEEKLLYWYKNSVAVPPLCMVDDILAIQECSQASLQTNAVINSFIELKKLKLSSKKCSKIHLGKDRSCCPQLKVHEENMKDSTQEKYLGDLINSSGKVKKTVEERVAKGYGIVSEILAMLDEIPLGSYRLEMGLKLREAMLLNGVLYNSEAWHSTTKEDIHALEVVDECLLRSLLENHPKCPIEFLYLETGSISIGHIVSTRRMMYLRTILKRDDEELTKRILREQQRNPTPGDFSELVKSDFNKYGIDYDENKVINMKEDEYRKEIRKHVKTTAFNELKIKQESHSKVRTIKYESLEKQPYLVSPIFSDEDVGILSNLRSHTTRGIRGNFKKLYRDNTKCPLQCWPVDSEPIEDNQEHLLVCSKIQTTSSKIACGKTVYMDIYGSTDRQKEGVTLFKELLNTRNSLLSETSPTSG